MHNVALQLDPRTLEFTAPQGNVQKREP